MRNKKFNIKIILLFTLLSLLIFPYLQVQLNLFKLKPLKGAIKKPVKKEFNFDNWFSGIYQEEQEKYLNETFGFRSFFIRVNNQLAFNLFKEAKANSVIVGKNNYLFEKGYINAYYGNDFVGYDSINNRMQRLKYIQDTLTKLDKDIFLIFAPGKGSFYPEYIPQKYASEKKTTNYEVHIELAQQLGIPYIDFKKYFVENKRTSPYPLFPQYGTHWSHYGMWLAADSIIRFIENIRNIEMPHLFWDEVDMHQPQYSDYDIAGGMNILFKLKSFDMAYQRVQFQSDSGKIKPSVLVVADSFYWDMFELGIAKSFTNSHYWYYNYNIYPENIIITQVNLKDEIAKHEVIIIMSAEANFKSLGWKFIEKVYDCYKEKE